METLKQGKKPWENRSSTISEMYKGRTRYNTPMYKLYQPNWALGVCCYTILVPLTHALSLLHSPTLCYYNNTLLCSLHPHNVCPRYIYTHIQYGLFTNVVHITTIIIVTVVVDQATGRLVNSTSCLLRRLSRRPD